MQENEQDFQYLPCAIKLAEEYPSLKKEHDRLVKRLEGNWIYTKEMAIADLDRHSVSYDRDRVQSSSISSPAERIAMAMTDKFMQKKQEELDWERQRCLHECRYVDWKLDILESVYRERMNPFQQCVFRLIFIQKLSFRKAREIMTVKRSNKDIIKARKEIWHHFCKELQIQEKTNKGFFMRLITEATNEKQKGRITHEKKEICRTFENYEGRYEASHKNG